MLCSFKFELPVDPVPLIEMVKQIDRGAWRPGDRAEPQYHHFGAHAAWSGGGHLPLVKGSVVNIGSTRCRNSYPAMRSVRSWCISSRKRSNCT